MRITRVLILSECYALGMLAFRAMLALGLPADFSFITGAMVVRISGIFLLPEPA